MVATAASASLETAATADGDGWPDRGPASGLSNDYLNHYGEALMLIELSTDDPEIAAELNAWKPIDYRSYFAASKLRGAPLARAAYDALPPERRSDFEELTAAMDKLVTTAILIVQPPCAPSDAAAAALATVPALRRLVELAAGFLNSGGRVPIQGTDVGAAQGVADRLLAKG